MTQKFDLLDDMHSAPYPEHRPRGTANSTRAHGRTARAWSLVVLAALFLTACGGGGVSSEASSAVIATAEQNQAQLKLSDNLAKTELLDGESGQVTSLGEVVTGDRPVLVWYWAPN